MKGLYMYVHLTLFFKLCTLLQYLAAVDQYSSIQLNRMLSEASNNMVYNMEVVANNVVFSKKMFMYNPLYESNLKDRRSPYFFFPTISTYIIKFYNIR